MRKGTRKVMRKVMRKIIRKGTRKGMRKVMRKGTRKVMRKVMRKIIRKGMRKGMRKGISAVSLNPKYICRMQPEAERDENEPADSGDNSRCCLPKNKNMRIIRILES